MGSGVRSLHLAVMRNDLDALCAVIASGVDVNQPWQNPLQPSLKDGCTALSEAVSLNHIQIAQTLLEAGASVSKTDGCGQTPLMKACYHGRHTIAAMLIKHGADTLQTDAEGNTCLQICVKNGTTHGNAKCVAVLLANGCSPSHSNQSGMSVLHSASAGATPQMLALLLAYGADVDAVDPHYRTPLYECVWPVLEGSRRRPSTHTRELFLRRLSRVAVLLLAADVDALGLPTWIHHWIFQPNINTGLSDWPDVSRWFVRNRPESLKHLCRVFIQNRLGFTEVRHRYCVRKVRQLEFLPDALKHYLCRKLIHP